MEVCGGGEENLPFLSPFRCSEMRVNLGSVCAGRISLSNSVGRVDRIGASGDEVSRAFVPTEIVSW